MTHKNQYQQTNLEIISSDNGLAIEDKKSDIEFYFESVSLGKPLELFKK
jgi:hypothetical protein